MVVESLAMLEPEVTWETERVSNELMDLAGRLLDRMLRVPSCF